MDKSPTAGTSVAGNVLFENLSPPHTRVHRVWNTDSTTFHVMDIELLSKDSGFSNAPLPEPHVRLLTDTAWARTYSVKLNTGEALSLDKGKSYFILVAIKDGTFLLTENGMKSRTGVAAGNFFLVKPGDSLDLVNQSNSEATFALVEIP